MRDGHLALDVEKPVEPTDGYAGQQDNEESQQPAPSRGRGVGDSTRHRRKAEHRADGEVYSRDEDDEELPDGQDGEDRGLDGDVGDVGARHEHGAEERHDQDEKQQDDDGSKADER